MRYIILHLIFSTVSLVFTQNDDTDEQAFFWTGSSDICYPLLDYEFIDKSNRGKVNTEWVLIVKCHIPLADYSRKSPDIRFPKRYKGEFFLTNNRL
jgi:hypothetical protein